MKKTLGILCMLSLLTMIMAACQDALVDEPDMESSTMATRAAGEDATLNDDCITVTFHEQTVTTDRTVQGSGVETKNVTVSNSAKLTIIGSEKVTLLEPLNINADCRFEIHAEQNKPENEPI